MVLTAIDYGSITLTADYQSILDTLIRAPRWFEGWIYLNELMTADDDTVEIKVWQNDKLSDTLRLYTHKIFNGTQTQNAMFIGGILSTKVKIEIAQTNATPTFKNVTYEFYEVS